LLLSKAPRCDQDIFLHLLQRVFNLDFNISTSVDHYLEIILIKLFGDINFTGKMIMNGYYCKCRCDSRVIGDPPCIYFWHLRCKLAYIRFPLKKSIYLSPYQISRYGVSYSYSFLLTAFTSFFTSELYLLCIFKSDHCSGNIMSAALKISDETKCFKGTASKRKGFVL